MYESISVHNEQKNPNISGEGVIQNPIIKPISILNNVRAPVSTKSIYVKKTDIVLKTEGVIDIVGENSNNQINNTASAYNSILQSGNFFSRIKYGVVWIYDIIRKGFLWLIN